MSEGIELPDGRLALVDKDMYSYLSQFSWRVNVSGSGHESVVRSSSRSLKSNANPISMHREIMGFPSCPVDHINRNPLDNRRSNLRLCSSSQNQHNRGPQRGRKFKGTVFIKRTGTWSALISAFGKKYAKHGFADEKSAARAYDSLAKDLHGEFAYQNFSEVNK